MADEFAEVSIFLADDAIENNKLTDAEHYANSALNTKHPVSKLLDNTLSTTYTSPLVSRTSAE